MAPPPPSPSIVISFDDPDALACDLEQNLRNGGAFAADVDGLNVGDLCKVELVHPLNDARLVLPARVVMVAAQGVALAFDDFTERLRQRLSEFVHNPPEPQIEEGAKSTQLHERLRGLPAAEQKRIARDGDLQERVVLERIYSKGVWEALLRNPRLTAPEVARISRMGLLPRPLLETIVGNPAWIGAAQVRRALLTNPRLTGEPLGKVLRAMPKSELRLLPKQTSYPIPVREAARRLLKP